MEVITFGNPFSHQLLALIITGIGLVIGVIVYLIMVYPSLRRAEFRTAQGCSPRIAAILAFIIIAAFASAAWWSYLSPFFRLELAADEAHMKFVFPTRTVSIARSSISRLERRAELTKSGTRLSLIIQTQKGQAFESMAVRPDQFEKYYAQVEQWLRKSEH